MTHDRTPLGRNFLKLRAGVHEWIKHNRSRATPQAIAEAEVLACNLGDAAWNGLAAKKAVLIEDADKIKAQRALVRR